MICTSVATVTNREPGDHFKYLASVLTRVGNSTREIKIVIAKEAFNRTISLLASKLNIELNKKDRIEDKRTLLNYILRRKAN